MQLILEAYLKVWKGWKGVEKGVEGGGVRKKITFYLFYYFIYFGRELTPKS